MSLSRIAAASLALNCLSAACLFLSGCVSESKGKKPAAIPEAGSQSIQEINVLAIPVALNFDERPGPDGFVIKVFASNRKRAKPLPIEKGSIEVLMFDGVPGMTEGASLQPKRIWSYSAEELKHFENTGSIGLAYQLAPLWGDAKPTGNNISVVVRYTAPSGATIASAPSVISVAN
jgi:hypothetical protein